MKKFLSIVIIVSLVFTILTFQPEPAQAEVITLSLVAFGTIAKIAGASVLTAGAINYLYNDYLANADQSLVSELLTLPIDNITGMVAISSALYDSVLSFIQSKPSGLYSTIAIDSNAILGRENFRLTWGANTIPTNLPLGNYSIFDRPENITGEVIGINEYLSNPARQKIFHRSDFSNITYTHYLQYGPAVWHITSSIVGASIELKHKIAYYDVYGTLQETATRTNIYPLSGTHLINNYANTVDIANITSGISTSDSYWNTKTYDRPQDEGTDLYNKRAIPPLPIDWLNDPTSSLPQSYDGTKTYDLDTPVSDVWTSTSTGSDSWPYEIPILGDILTGLQSIANAISNVFAIPDTLNIEWSYLHVGLTDRFPFSIPFDLVAAFTGWQAVPAAPQWVINWKSASHTIDFSIFNPLATIIRWGILIIFNFGLIVSTRKLIRG